MPAGTGLGDYEYEKGGTKPVFELKHNGVILQAGKDYTLKYRNHTQITHRDEITPVNDKVPFATVEVRGKGNYTGVKTYTYCILPCELQTSGGRVKLSVSDVVYKKKAGNYISKPVLKDANGKILKAGTDYDKEVIYLLPDGMILDKKMTVSVGATIYGQVNGKGNYSGAIRFSYMIKPIDFKKVSVKIRSQVYNGKEITLSADDIVVKHDGNTLEMGKDFIILEDSYKNNIQKGTAKVTVMGIGEYAGMKEVSYKITSKQLIWGKFLPFIDR